jgi:hypothetical protein
MWKQKMYKEVLCELQPAMVSMMAGDKANLVLGLHSFLKEEQLKTQQLRTRLG